MSGRTWGVSAVHLLQPVNDRLYVMGSFTQPFVNIAAWDGTDLLEVPPLPVDDWESYYPYTSTAWRNQWVLVAVRWESPSDEYLFA